MPRDQYVETICSIAADGTLKAIADVEVTVTKSDGSPVTIYTGRAGGSTKANPFVTDASGLAAFWAEENEYNIAFHDLIAPARVADVSFGWVAGRGAAQVGEGFDVGDIKISAKTTDHGRWIRLDGRELTQSELEGTLSLDAGQGAALIAELGTGTSSKYGDAAAGKIKLPDTRRRFWIGAGPASGTPSYPAGTSARPFKGTGSFGGAESVTLTANQSGVPSHGHTLTDPGHGHGNTFAIASGGEHFHTVITTGNWSSVTYNTEQFLAGGGNRTASRISGTPSQVMTATGNADWAGAHSHTLNGAVSSNTTGISVANHAGASASQSHDNMPPFVVIGYCFMRV